MFLLVLNFADKEDQKTIHVLIKKDNTPELSETIAVELLYVQLVSGSPKNYSVVDGLPLNTPPRISSDKNKVMIVIEENDDARGIVRFTESSKLVREESEVVVLQLVREGKLGKVFSCSTPSRKQRNQVNHCFAESLIIVDVYSFSIRESSAPFWEEKIVK